MNRRPYSAPEIKTMALIDDIAGDALIFEKIVNLVTDIAPGAINAVKQAIAGVRPELVAKALPESSEAAINAAGEAALDAKFGDTDPAPAPRMVSLGEARHGAAHMPVVGPAPAHRVDPVSLIKHTVMFVFSDSPSGVGHHEQYETSFDPAHTWAIHVVGGPLKVDVGVFVRTGAVMNGLPVYQQASTGTKPLPELEINW